MKNIAIFFILLTISGISFGQIFMVSSNKSIVENKYYNWKMIENSHSKLCYKSIVTTIGDIDTINGNGVNKCFFFNEKNICYKEVCEVDLSTGYDLFLAYMIREKNILKITGGYFYKKENIFIEIEKDSNLLRYIYTSYNNEINARK